MKASSRSMKLSTFSGWRKPSSTSPRSRKNRVGLAAEDDDPLDYGLILELRKAHG
jgi:hypothetical protein